VRTVPLAWTALETARKRQVALLFHIWIRRDAATSGLTSGRVTPPVGWGSWTYSVGFQGNVSFTDLANYAQDWAAPGTPTTRTYVPAAIEFDPSQIFRKEDTSLDPHDITLTVDPSLEPFADYVNRSWPLAFGITIYKVHRAGPSSIATVDNGSGTQVPVVDVLFVGFLHADDTLELNSAGLELEISPSTGSGQAATAKLSTAWDHVTKLLDRLVPPPVFSINCPKSLFSTGNGAAVDCNADMPSAQITGTVTAKSGIIISAVEWGSAAANGAFAGGRVIYTATDPVSGLDFTFTLLIIASAQRTAGGVTYGDLWFEMFPPLLIVGTVVQAFLGCDGARSTCMSRFIPAGSQPAVAGTFTPGTLRVSLQLIETFLGSSGQNPKGANVYITATKLWIVYGRDNSNQIENIYLGAGAGNPWDPTWTSQGSTIITSPVYTLASASPAIVGPPAQAGYHITISNDGATATISQRPSAKNGYVTIIHCGGGSPAIFDFTIAWIANTGTVQALGNLENFGGSDTPIEHPSLETTS
jgi:hypothetical protein